jgi:DNA-binding transcriptional ArsR family regulator
VSGWQWNGLVQTRTLGSPTRKSVLMFLADVAGEDGSSYYRVETMAAALELGEKTIRRALKEFEDTGLLTRVRSRRDDGTLGQYRYLLQWGPIAALPWNGTRSGGSGTDPFRTMQPPVTDALLPVTVTGGPPVTQSPTTGHSDRAEPPVVTPATEPPENEPSAPFGDDVTRLCDQLAEKVANQQDGRRPPITDRWRTDMRLLLERGPLHQDTPEPVGAEKVGATIDYVFEHLAEPQGRGGFCWAAQVRSPAALRDHWHQMADAARRLRAAQRGPTATAIDRAVARLRPDTPNLFTPPTPAGPSWAARALGAGQ